MLHVDLPGETFPFSQAVGSGSLLFVAGQLASDDPDWAGPATIEAETAAAMRRIGRVLVAGGATFADVVRVGVFMVDLQQFDRMNAVYRTYFADGQLPARTCVGVSALLNDALIEIDCVATIPTLIGAS